MKDRGCITIKTQNKEFTTPKPVCLKNNHVLTLFRYRKDTGDPVRIVIEREGLIEQNRLKDGG